MEKKLNTINCHKCSHRWSFDGTLSRGDECPSCNSCCKVCLNCNFYDSGSHHECREPQAEWVKYKDQGNFCSYFTPIVENAYSKSSQEGKLDKLNALFKADKNLTQSSPKIDSLSQLFTKKDPNTNQNSQATIDKAQNKLSDMDKLNDLFKSKDD